MLALAGCGGDGGSTAPQQGARTFTVPARLPQGTTTSPVAPGGRGGAPAPAPAGGPAEPTVVLDLIPFGPRRRAEMEAYAQRHYGFDDYHLRDPHVIVEHYTVTPTFSATYNTFAADVPDPELHELPATCAHFVIDRDGTIHQLVPVSIMCRHTVGLNWTAIGIEHVGESDQEVEGDRAQWAASLRLTTWLRCRFHIAVKDVIGHSESLSSPYHRENVAALRTQTHADMQPPTMDRYRADLARSPC